MRAPVRLVLPLTLAALVAGAAPSPAAAPSSHVLRLDGIGPLKLGMTRTAALATGWLAERRRGCELGGNPIPIAYRLSGDKAPDGLDATAEFRYGHLRNIAVNKGARTALGVRPGHTTITRMVARYRAAGYRVRSQFLDTFDGTFVTVSRGGRQVLGGFGRRTKVDTVAIRGVPVCE